MLEAPSSVIDALSLAVAEVASLVPVMGHPCVRLLRMLEQSLVLVQLWAESQLAWQWFRVRAVSGQIR